ARRSSARRSPGSCETSSSDQLRVVPDVAKARLQEGVARLLDGARSALPMHEFLVALAAILYLRWIDFHLGEQEAVAALDGSPDAPPLPERFRWGAIRGTDLNRLTEVVGRDLADYLAGLDQLSPVPLAIHLSRISPSVARLGRLPATVLRE